MKNLNNAIAAFKIANNELDLLIETLSSPDATITGLNKVESAQLAIDIWFAEKTKKINSGFYSDVHKDNYTVNNARTNWIIETYK